MTTDQIWQAVLGNLELSLSKANFNTWFRGTFILSLDETSVIIGVPTAFSKSWLENKYKSDILKTIKEITENINLRSISFKVESIKNKPITEYEPQPEEKEIEIPITDTAQNNNQFGLNPKYTFDKFIVGKSNELARAASIAISENPGQTYNPLYIYGGAGLGKTHLMHAVGNEIYKKAPTKKVLYITCEKFTNDYIHSVTNGTAYKFKDIYRSVDVLLIDDIQFLAGKEGTQEEFFHTFNALHQYNKQVVISSDRPPKAISALEERLLTRFEWGMIADISQPDLETRIAILEAKLQHTNVEIPSEIINFIASNFQHSIRELEGALNRLIAHMQINSQEVNLSWAKKLLGDLLASPSKKSITPKDIIKIVSNYYDITIDSLIGKCREKRLVVPRQIIMYLLRSELNCSYPSIGHELGGRDHTTAIHACTKIGKDYQNDDKLKREVEQLKERLYSN